MKKDEIRDSDRDLSLPLFLNCHLILHYCSFCSTVQTHRLVQGLALTPDDAWAVHAVAHIYEMKAEVDKGLKFMEGREKDWQVQPLAQ